LSQDYGYSLLEAVPASHRTLRGLAGADRFALHLTAAGTGLRVSELTILTPKSFGLTATPPTVRLRSGYTKNRKQAEPPLPAALADVLRDSLAGRPADTAVWPGGSVERAAGVLSRDLTNARNA
jgi:hypothetical protein